MCNWIQSNHGVVDPCPGFTTCCTRLVRSSNQNPPSKSHKVWIATNLSLSPLSSTPHSSLPLPPRSRSPPHSCKCHYLFLQPPLGSRRHFPVRPALHLSFLTPVLFVPPVLQISSERPTPSRRSFHLFPPFISSLTQPFLLSDSILLNLCSMTSTFPMVLTATAPIDIQSFYPSCSTAAELAPSCKTATTGESFGDSGYESSWPSLSEASVWSPSGQKQLLSLKSVGGNTNQSVSFHHASSVQGQGRTQKKPRHAKDQRGKVRMQDYQAQRTVHPQCTMPLVDFGSPQMEDDQCYGPPGPPIPIRLVF